MYPGDVERVLTQHPAVADAGVVPRDGIGKGFVVLAAGKAASEDDLLEFCRARLAAHQVPASVTFVDRLPRSSVGKLLRRGARSARWIRFRRDLGERPSSI